MPRLQLVPAFSNIRKSSFNRRSGVSIATEERYSSASGSQVSDDKDFNEQDGSEEIVEVQWVNEEDNTDDESFTDSMAKKSFAHFVALIQRRSVSRTVTPTSTSDYQFECQLLPQCLITAGSEKAISVRLPAKF